MSGFLNKILGKCPNCNKKIPTTDYDPKQPKNTAICYWTHHKSADINGKFKSIQYCKDCYKELKKENDGLFSDTLYTPMKELECNLCGLTTQRYKWHHVKMYIEKDTPPEKRSHYFVLVCDGCFESLGEKKVTTELQKPGFV